MQQAASSGSSAQPSGGCQDCVKQGLAILPVVPMAVPVSLRGKTDGLTQLDNRYSAADLQESWMVLRSLPAGYLYVLHPDLSWDIYLVDREGLLRKMPSPSSCPASPSQQPPMSALCKRSGHNVPAQVIAIDPKKSASVWLAFSRYRWTQNVLNAYAKNTDKCRDQRMTKLDVMAAAAGSLGSTSKASNAVRFGVPMSASVNTIVADYADDATRNALNGACFETVLNRSAQSKALADTMARFSAQTQAKTGAIIALDDDLGVAMAINAFRNAAQVERAQVLAAYVRHEFVNRAAAGFKKQCELQKNSKRWNEKYATAYSQPALDNALKERANKLKPIDTRLPHLAADWVSAIKSSRLAAIIRHDFDSQVLDEGLQCAIAAASCLHGAGSQAAERTLLQAWINGDVSDPGNIIWQALAGNNKTLIARLGDAKDLMPPAWDSAKNAWAAADEFFKSLTGTQAALVQRLREGAKDPVADALAKLLHCVAAATDTAVAPLGKAAAKAVLLTALWTGVRMQPVQQRMSPWQALMDAKTAGWGQPAAARVRTVRKVNTVSWRYDLLEVADVIRAKGGTAILITRYAVASVWRGSRWVDTGDVTLVSPSTGSGPRGQAPGAPATPDIHATPAKNVLARGIKLAREGGANGLLASGVLVFQTLSFLQAQKDLEGEGSASKGVELSAAYYAAMAGMLGATSEIAAAAIQAGAHTQGIKLVGNMAGFVRGAAALGGVLGGISGIAMAVSSWSKASTLKATGDTDAATWSSAVGWASFGSALTGSVGALTASDVAAAEAGTASLVGGTLLGIGPAGWAILTVGLVVIGLYLAYQAAEATDDPIESWLKQSIAGAAPQKFKPDAEVAAYNALFSLPLEVSLTGNGGFGVHTTQVSITAPALDPQSVLDYRLELTDRQQGSLVVTDTLHLNGEKSSPAIPAGLRAGGFGRPLLTDLSKVDASSAQVRLMIQAPVLLAGNRDPATGQILSKNQYTITQAKLTVKYFPLAKTDPSWVMPDSAGRTESYSPT